MRKSINSFKFGFICRLLCALFCLFYVAGILLRSIRREIVHPSPPLSTVIVTEQFGTEIVEADKSSVIRDAMDGSKVEGIIEERINRVHEYCKSLYSFRVSHWRQRTLQKWIVTSISAQPNITKHVDLQWCPVFKAASTPWLVVLLKLKNRLSQSMEDLVRNGQTNFINIARTFGMTYTGYSRMRNVQDLERMNFSRQIQLSLLIVRHPFERLLSAYRDKLEKREGRDYYHQRFGRYIVRLFRSKRLATTAWSLTIPVKQFMSSYFNGFSGGPDFDTNTTSYVDDTPTFGEFVRYLLTRPPAQMNEHWRPIYVDCNACFHKFNFIMKVETMDRDRNYLFNLLGANSDLMDSLNTAWQAWANKATVQSKKPSPIRSITEYFSKVPQKDLHKLYEIYEPDFAMFNYKAEPYLT